MIEKMDGQLFGTRSDQYAFEKLNLVDGNYLHAAMNAKQLHNRALMFSSFRVDKSFSEEFLGQSYILL